jgi:hypothetical protein
MDVKDSQPAYRVTSWVQSVLPHASDLRNGSSGGERHTQRRHWPDADAVAGVRTLRFIKRQRVVNSITESTATPARDRPHAPSSTPRRQRHRSPTRAVYTKRRPPDRWRITPPRNTVLFRITAADECHRGKRSPGNTATREVHGVHRTRQARVRLSI